MKRVTMFLAVLALSAPALAQQPTPAPAAPAAGQRPGGAPGGAPGGRQAGPPPIDVPWNDAIPAGTADHAARALKESPRHGEWVDIKLTDGGILKAWVTYPERPDKAGVVLVIHDIGGMKDIPRAVGDQLAQDGFISIVPDFLSGKGPNGGGTDSLGTGVNQAIMGLPRAEVNARLDAAMAYGKKLPSSNGKTAVIGFCWGGAGSFAYAAAQPALSAAVVYYGQAPGSDTTDATVDSVAAQLANLKAPVLGNLRGQRRAHRRDDSGDRSRDEEARQVLRGAHVRRRRARLHGRAGRHGRRQPQGGAGVLADRRRVPDEEPEVK